MSAARARRLADRIQEIVAARLQRGVKDPRLGFVTITDVRVTNDLREATAFYTAFGTEQERADTAEALASLTGMLRTEVGRQTGIKFTPTLSFVLDAVPENASHIDELLAAAREADAAVERAAAAASYAGDPDPYRRPVDEDELDADLDDSTDDLDGDLAGDDPDDPDDSDADADGPATADAARAAEPADASTDDLDRAGVRNP